MSATTGVPGEPSFGSMGWATYSPTHFRVQPGFPRRADSARGEIFLRCGERMGVTFLHALALSSARDASRPACMWGGGAE